MGPIPNALEQYAEAFDFVEVNSTFYEHPAPNTVREWRQRVPRQFEFAVKCHNSVTHMWGLSYTPENVADLDRVSRTCRELGAIAVVLETPKHLRLDADRLRSANKLLDSLDFDDTRIVMEVRNEYSRTPTLARFMKERSIVHCTDISRELPLVESRTLYSRLFGPSSSNVYQFDDHELTAIDRRARKADFEQSILAFHGVKMYSDAARLKSFQRSGSFPKITSSTGLHSLHEVLAPDVEFPITRGKLLAGHGWKLFDLDFEHRVRAREFLERLPDRGYRSLVDVMETLRAQSVLKMA